MTKDQTLQFHSVARADAGPVLCRLCHDGVFAACDLFIGKIYLEGDHLLYLSVLNIAGVLACVLTRWSLRRPDEKVI